MPLYIVLLDSVQEQLHLLRLQFSENCQIEILDSTEVHATAPLDINAVRTGPGDITEAYASSYVACRFSRVP
jgi:hypothetical protein